MGNIFNRQNARVEELDLIPNNAYRYPPKAGTYFASHFIMGAERFETTQPEAFLFGENMDLNFLGSRPTPFPYPAPQQPNEPTRTLRSLINIRKESLRFVKAPENADGNGIPGNTFTTNTSYNIDFTFDSDVRCAITIHYFCTEEVTANGVFYTPRDSSMKSSETFHYKKGVNQLFSQVSHVFDPSKYSEETLSYKVEDDIIPVLIQCVAEEGEEPRQSHMVIAIVEKNLDGSYILKTLKQKLFCDGLCYLLQEIYGIENKNQFFAKDNDDDVEDNGAECVICMSDPRDTLILPCRHLCLCNSCSDSLRYQANNCPICRAPFRALLQIRAVRKCSPTAVLPQANAESQSSQDTPPGYEPVSLIEALNGPLQPAAPLLPSFPPNAPPFSNSPDMRHKQRERKLERHSSSVSSLRPADNSIAEKEGISVDRVQGKCIENSPTPEVVVAALISPDKSLIKAESLSLTRGEAKRHRKGFRTSSAPEKIRLLANSVEIVNEVGGAKRKIDKDAEVAETRSLLENNLSLDEVTTTVTVSPRISRPCNRSSPVSLSTPHSLHLCEKSNKAALGSDASPGDEDSDYYTPEDPSTTILVDQGTDTSLDTPQSTEPNSSSECSLKSRTDNLNVKHRYNKERQVTACDVPTFTCTNAINIQDSSDHSSEHSKSLKNTDDISESPYSSSNRQSLTVHSENPSSLPGTPASNASNNSSGGDSFSSTSSTRLLLQHQSYETLQE